MVCDRLHYMGLAELPPGEPLSAFAKIRYHHPAVPAEITMTGDGLLLTFDSLVRAPAPGQAAVWYDEDGCVLGGGRIAGVRE